MICDARHGLHDSISIVIAEVGILVDVLELELAARLAVPSRDAFSPASELVARILSSGLAFRRIPHRCELVSFSEYLHLQGLCRSR